MKITELDVNYYFKSKSTLTKNFKIRKYNNLQGKKRFYFKYLYFYLNINFKVIFKNTR